MATSGAPTRDIGHLDSNYGTLYGELLEQIPALTWPLSAQTYALMRHDPQLTAVLSSYTLPIRRATWSVDPAGCRDEVVQVVADDLGLPILGVDAEPGPARRRGVRWADHLRLALLSLTFGFMPFERRYQILNGQARLVALGERMPHTIGSIQLARDESVESITQNLAATRPIPANRLVWYAHDREAANWTGRSMLRASYGAWLLKHETWRVHATSIRRFGMGVPTVDAPPGGTPGQVAEAQRLASAMRVGDRAGAGMPNGFVFKLTGLTGSVPDALGFIHYLDQQMSRSALAGLMDLGDTSNGSRALGNSFLDLFLLSLQSIADEIADTATTGQTGTPGIVTDIVDLNWGEDEPAPRIVVSDVGSRQEVTAEALEQLMRSGALAPDPALEAYVRDAWRLPERTEPVRPAAPPMPPAPGSDPEPAREGQALAASRHRPARNLRAAAEPEPDLAAVQEAWQAALDTVLADWPALAEDQRAELAEQIEKAVDAGDLAALAALTVGSEAAATLLAVAMLELAETSAEQMAAEAAAQGVQVQAPPPDQGQLEGLAAAVAALLAAGLAGAAASAALRMAAPGAAGAAVAADVLAVLARLSDRAVRDQIGGALSAAQAAGRFAVLHEAPAARYLASETLDRSTCKNCREIDGTTFDDLAAAQRAYGNGAYTQCLGGVRCRGQVVAIWEQG